LALLAALLTTGRLSDHLGRRPVVLLALLPFVFLVTLQLLASTLLAPFRSPVGLSLIHI